MRNDRPIENPELRAALAACQQIIEAHDLAAALMLVASDEVAFTYRLATTWSAIMDDPETPLGIRIRASTDEHGAEGAHQRLEGAAHTVCQLGDFGQQTAKWMGDLLQVMRRAGMEIEHRSFGGEPLGNIIAQEDPEPAPGGLSEERVKAIALPAMEAIRANFQRGPRSRDRVFEALNALAFAGATVILGAGDRDGRRDARKFFDKALDQNIAELVRSRHG